MDLITNMVNGIELFLPATNRQIYALYTNINIVK